MPQNRNWITGPDGRRYWEERRADGDIVRHYADDSMAEVQQRRNDASQQRWRERYDSIANSWLERASNAPSEAARRVAMLNYRAAIARRDGDNARADRLKARAQELATFLNTELPIFDSLSQQENAALKNQFREDIRAATSRAVRGSQRAAAEAVATRGLTGGVAASIEAQATVGLLSKAAQQEADFSRALAMITKNNRDAAIAKKFDFFNQVQLLDKQAEFQKELLAYQQKLQNDNFFRDLFAGIVQTGASIVTHKALDRGSSGATAGGQVSGNGG